MQRRLLLGLGLLLLLAGPALRAEAPSPTLAKLRSAGVITLGYRAASVPFSYLDARLRPIGYSIELCERVVDALRQEPGLQALETRLLAVSSGTRLPLVANGSVDIECGITTNTLERQKSVAFSLTTFVTESRLLSKRRRPIDSLEQLRGQAVASTIGTTSIALLQELNERRAMGMRIIAGLDDVDSFRLLNSDQALAYAMDDVLLHGLLAGEPRAADFQIARQALSVEPYALMLPQDPAFKRLVDAALHRLYASGEMAAIYRRWFESPLPARPGVNLRMPMSAALKKAIAEPTDSADPAAYR